MKIIHGDSLIELNKHMTYTEKILAEFDDYFFEATRGRNDIRREKITSSIQQAYQEGYEDLSGNFCLEVKEHDNKIREEMLKRVVGEIGEKRKKLWQFYHEAQLWEEQKAIVKPLDEILVFLQDINNKEDI